MVSRYATSSPLRDGRVRLDGEPGTLSSPFVFVGETFEIFHALAEHDHVEIVPAHVPLLRLQDKVTTVLSIFGRHLRVILQALQELALPLEQAVGDFPGTKSQDVRTLQLGIGLGLHSQFPVNLRELYGVEGFLIIFASIIAYLERRNAHPEEQPQVGDGRHQVPGSELRAAPFSRPGLAPTAISEPHHGAQEWGPDQVPDEMEREDLVAVV